MDRLLGAGLILILLSCASPRTKYHSYKGKQKGGFSQEKVDANLDMISFRANSFTKISEAELFAKFRAIESCAEAGKKYSHIISLVDRSQSKTITRSNSHVYGFPSYYYGHSPFYHRYSGIGFSAGFNTISTNSWDETLIYPHTDIIYRCRDEIYEPEIILREVPAEEMKHLVKDLKGALQIEKILEGSPNKKLAVGDILLRAGRERVEKNYQVLRHFDSEKQGVPVELLRDGERVRLNLASVTVTQQVSASQQDIIKSACKFKEIKKRSLCRSGSD